MSFCLDEALNFPKPFERSTVERLLLSSTGIGLGPLRANLQLPHKSTKLKNHNDKLPLTAAQCLQVLFVLLSQIFVIFYIKL